MKKALASPTRRTALLGAVAALALGATACGDSGTAGSTTSTGSAAGTAKPKIGLVMKSLSNEFFKQMQAGAEEYAKTKTADFDFKAVGMKDERDFAAQVDAVDTFVADKYDIIVVAPADSKAMVAPLKRAIDAGVTVINIDVPLDKAAMQQAGVDLPFFGPTTPRARGWRARPWPRPSARAERRSSSRGTPRPTTPSSARRASRRRPRRASSRSSPPRPRTGRPRRPTP